jgi:hypothetical protein
MVGMHCAPAFRSRVRHTTLVWSETAKPVCAWGWEWQFRIREIPATGASGAMTETEIGKTIGGRRRPGFSAVATWLQRCASFVPACHPGRQGRPHVQVMDFGELTCRLLYNLIYSSSTNFLSCS